MPAVYTVWTVLRHMQCSASLMHLGAVLLGSMPATHTCTPTSLPPLSPPLQHVSRAMDALQAMVAHLEQNTVRGIEQRLAAISTMLQLPEQEQEAAPGPSQAAPPAEPSQGAAPAERLQYVEHSLALVQHMVSELYDLLSQARPAPGSETIPAYRAEPEAVKGSGGPAAAAAAATAAAAPLLLELSKLQQQLEGQEGRASGQEVAVQHLGVVSAQLVQRVEALEAGLAKGSAGPGQEGVYPLNPLYFTADSRPDSRSAVAGEGRMEVHVWAQGVHLCLALQRACWPASPGAVQCNTVYSVRDDGGDASPAVMVPGQCW